MGRAVAVDSESMVVGAEVAGGWSETELAVVTALGVSSDEEE
jgi:hypothetical protein